MSLHRFVDRATAEDYLRAEGFAPSPDGQRWQKVTDGRIDYADLIVEQNTVCIDISHAKVPSHD